MLKVSAPIHCLLVQVLPGDPFLSCRQRTITGFIICLHAEKNPKYCKTETTTRTSQPQRAASRASAPSLPPAALPVPFGRSLLGTTCPLGRCEYIRALILLLSTGACAWGSYTSWRKDSCPRSWVPLGHPCCSSSQCCGTFLGSMGAELRDAETDPPPCLTHYLPCRTEARHPPLLLCSPHLTITSEKPTPLAQKPPAEKVRCNIPSTAASKDFSQDPQGEFLFQAAQAAPSPTALQGQGGPLTLQGFSRSLAQQCPRYHSARDPHLHCAQHLPPNLLTAHQKEVVPALAGVPAGKLR